MKVERRRRRRGRSRRKRRGDADGRCRPLLCEKEQRDKRRYGGHRKVSGGRCLVAAAEDGWSQGGREAGETPACRM